LIYLLFFYIVYFFSVAACMANKVVYITRPQLSQTKGVTPL